MKAEIPNLLIQAPATMDWLQAVWLALIQGLTEFLPVSSSAHLILASKLLGLKDQGLAFDVAVHLGTLIAVLAFFRKEVTAMATDFFASVFKGRHTRDSRLAWMVLWATVPVGLLGLAFALLDIVELYLRETWVIATTTIGFGLLLGVADKYGSDQRDEYQLTWRDVLFIGLAQALALIPGTSRSGITMTAALLLGLNRTASARFSFLLSIPAILLPGALQSVKLATGEAAVDWSAMAIGVVVAAVIAYLTIHWFMKLLERIGFQPFVWYRMVLGLALFGLVFWG